MSCFDKEDYKALKVVAKQLGVSFIVSDNPTYNSNGVVIAYMSMIENTNGKMLLVAVSYCSLEDKFKPKHGKYQAIAKLARSEAVQLPLAEMLRGPNGRAYVEEALLDMFIL